MLNLEYQMPEEKENKYSKFNTSQSMNYQVHFTIEIFMENMGLEIRETM